MVEDHEKESGSIMKNIDALKCSLENDIEKFVYIFCNDIVSDCDECPKRIYDLCGYKHTGIRDWLYREFENEKKGTWLKDDIQNHVELTYHCSECGFEAWGENELTKYCGGCGAQMDREET